MFYFNLLLLLTACALLVVVLQTVSSEFSVGTESSTQSGEQVAASVAATLHPTPTRFVVNAYNASADRSEMRISFVQMPSLCPPNIIECPNFIVMSRIGLCEDEPNDVGMGYAEESADLISYAVPSMLYTLQVRLHCLVSRLKFEVELSARLVRVGRIRLLAGGPFAGADWWPLFRTQLIGVWEIDADTSE